MKTQAILKLGTVATLMACAMSAWADSYPSRTVKLIVPYAPGGTVDLVARVIGQKLTEQLGQPFIIENRPGASGLIGSEAVAKAAPDGYTLLVQSPTLVASPLLMKRTPYDAKKDFTAISLLGSVPMVVLANPGVPASNLRDFSRIASADPNKYAFGTSAVGSPMHLALEAIKRDAKLSAPIVIYKGTSSALTDVIGGQTSMIVDALPSSASHIAAGKLKPLAVTTKQRLPSMPNVPTVAESGIPDFEMVTWYGLWGPAKLPPAVLQKLNAEVAIAMRSSFVAERLSQQSFTPSPSTPAEFSAYLDKETANYARIIKSANIKID